MADTLRGLDAEELSALALLDDGAEMDEAIAATGLTHEQIVEANNLRAVLRRTNGGVAANPPQTPGSPAPVVDLVLPQRPTAVDAVDDAVTPLGADAVLRLPELLARADMVGGVRAKFLAGRVRGDAEELAEEIAADEMTWTARERVEELRAQLADAESELRRLGGMPASAPRKTAAKKTAKPARKPAAAKRGASRDALPYSQQVREWARANGHEVGANGRLRNDVVEAYRAAHQPDAQG